MKNYLTSADAAGANRQDDVPHTISRRHKLTSCMAAAIAGLTMLTTYDVEAVDAKKKPKKSVKSEQAVNELQAQVDRLNRELAASKQRELELLKKGSAAAPAAAAAVAGQAPAENAIPSEAAAPEETLAKVEEAEKPKDLTEVTVTARRKEEKLQDVPIPIAVISGEMMKRDNIVSVQDFSRRVPNLGVTSANARQTSIALRGLGKNSGNESMESSVGVMIDNVWQSWVGNTWTNFADIDHIEVLRGPQGTLQGKNSNLGLINITSMTPSFKSGYYVDGFGGSRDAVQGKVSATGGIIDGVLAYRASIYVDRRDGFIQNLDTPATAGNLQETNALGGKLQFLFTPTENLSARIIVDRSSATQTMSVSPLINDPTNFADGSPRVTASKATFSSRLGRDWFNYIKSSGQPLYVIGDPRKLAQNDKQVSRADQEGVSGEINWKVAGHKFTSISAYRDGLFEPHHDGDASTASIYNIGGVTIDSKQWSQEFRLASLEPAFNFIDYQVGAFGMRTSSNDLNQALYGADAGAFYATNAQYTALNATSAGKQAMQQSLNGMYKYYSVVPEVTSLAGFGQVNLHFTDKANLTLGLRETWEHRDNAGYANYRGGASLASINALGLNAAQQAAVADIRSKTMGPVWNQTRQGFEQSSENWLVNPSYKFTQDLMAYFSVGGGQKSGAAQFNTTSGAIQNVKPEDIMDYELGVKTAWFNKKLVVNANLYQTDIEGFQSQLTVPDATASSGYTTVLGNIKGIQLRGVELETNWQATPTLNFFMNGSYNHAVYTDFKNAPCPPESTAPVCDQTGMTIPNAPQFTANYGVDYRVPLGFGIWDDHGFEWHAFLVDSYKSRANYNSSLSVDGKQTAYHVTDGGLGISTKNHKYSLDLVGRNMFDSIYLTNVGGFTNTAASSGTYGEARYFGVHFRGNF